MRHHDAFKKVETLNEKVGVLPVKRRLEGDPEVLLKLEVPCLEPIFACGRGQTLVALESLQKIV